MVVMTSQITSVAIVYSTVHLGPDQRKPINSPHKGPVTRKMFPFDDVIMAWQVVLFDSCEDISMLVTYPALTRRGRVAHVCIIICLDNDLSPVQHQAICWSNAGLFSIGPLETNFHKILIKMQQYPHRKITLNKSSAKWRPFYLDLNVSNVGNVSFSAFVFLYLDI